MATDDMSIEERYQYLRRMQPRYQQADRATKQQLLDEMVAYTGLHRKSLLRRLNGSLQRQPRQREREKSYGPEVDAALTITWETLDYICPLRLQPNLVSSGRTLARHGELVWSPHLEAQLAQISVSSIGRHLPPRPPEQRRRQPAAPPNRHQQAIPAYRIPRDIAEPGHFEIDLVHHCGARTEGEYVYTVQMIDVATGWGARRAILGRSYIVMADALAYLFAQLPFPVLELHPDNGSEFLNAHLLAFLEEEYAAIEPARSRPGCPNDNRLVEEKNGSVVRRWLGDRRLDTVMQTRWLNTIYDQLYRYHNYFIPVLKQIDKVWVLPTAARQGYIKRTHDAARTPLERFSDLDNPGYTAQYQALCRERETLNPRQLRRDIVKALDHLFAYPNAASSQVENVYETLADPERFPEAVAALRAVGAVDKPKSSLPTAPTAPTTTATTSSFLRKEAA
ncbi:MAG: transposase family protein [Gammaproteobacteria bacterium]|nr:transposase family protein [Gammaproteobacteria bacterium]